MKKFFTGVLLSFFSCFSEVDFKYLLEGYVKEITVSDSRQILAERDGVSFDEPAPFVPDCRGRDENAHALLNMSAIETNAKLTISGPKIHEMETAGIIAAEFFAPTDASLNSFYDVHAFIKLEAPKYVWYIGQFWHPTYVSECFPGIIGYDNASPIEVFIRSPQIRFIRRWEKGELIFAASSQANYFSSGPLGDSSVYMRDAIIPNMHAQIKMHYDDYLYGIGFDVKRLVPRIVNDFNCIVHESVTCPLVLAYAKRFFQDENTYLSMKVIFGGNGSDIGMISGYALATRNDLDQRTYAPVYDLSWWFDSQYQKNNVQLGLFFGFTVNVGTFRNLFIDPATGQPTVYVTSPILPNSAYETRLAPRITWKKLPLQFSFEFNAICAGFGPLNRHGSVSNPVNVTDYRCMFAAFYYF